MRTFTDPIATIRRSATTAARAARAARAAARQGDQEEAGRQRRRAAAAERVAVQALNRAWTSDTAHKVAQQAHMFAHAYAWWEGGRQPAPVPERTS